MTRRSLRFALPFLLLLGLTGTAVAEDYIRILTATRGGIYHPLGEALGAAYQSVHPTDLVAVQTSRGSLDNLHMLNFGLATVGFTTGDVLQEAYSGGLRTALIQEPLTNLRTVAALYPNFLQVVARADSGLGSISDLRGKRVAVGEKRSATEINARLVIEANGLTYADFAEVHHGSFNEAVDMITQGQLDAAFLSAGLGAGAINKLAEAVPIRVIPISQEAVSRLNDPLRRSGMIPAGTYPGQTIDVPSLEIANFLVTHAGANEQMIYEITRLLFDARDTLIAGHKAATDISLQGAVGSGLPAPLHPGAERLYRERGAIQ